MKIFQNKFFITFLILAIAIYGLSTRIAQAKGVFNWVTYIFVAVIAVFVPYLLPTLFTAGGLLTSVAEFGIAAGLVACQFGSDNAFFSGCGGNIGGVAINAPTLIPSMAGECRVGLVLPSFYEPWPSQSVGVTTINTLVPVLSSGEVYGDTNYLSGEINKLGGEYKNLPLSDVSLSGNLSNNGFIIRYNGTAMGSSVKTITSSSSMTMNQFRQNYGEIKLNKDEYRDRFNPDNIIPASVSTPEQFITDGKFFSTSTVGGYEITAFSDIVWCLYPNPDSSSGFDNYCHLLFQPKGQTTQYEITEQPTFRATRIIPSPLDESEYDVELYRFALPKPNLIDTALDAYLTSWFYNTIDLRSKGFNIAPGPGIYNFSFSQNSLFQSASTTYSQYFRYAVPPNDGHFYRFAKYLEPTTTSQTGLTGCNHLTSTCESVKVSSYKYKNVCANGICNLVDPNPPEGKYLIYEAKIKGNFGKIYDEGIGMASVLSKYLNTDNSQSSWFSWFWNNCKSGRCKLYKGDGNIAYGPIAPIVLPSQDSCNVAADVRITAISCDSVTLSVTVPFIDQAKFSGYDVYRDNNLIASNIPISQPVYEDKGLSKRTEYTYKVVVKTTDNMAQDFNLPAVKTTCVPDCSLSASPNSLIYPSGQTKVSWQCQEADSCALTSSNLPKNYPTVEQFCSSVNGSIQGTDCQVSNTGYVSPSLTLDQTTTFILACQNIDGSSTNTATVDFLKSRRIETIPR